MSHLGMGIPEIPKQTLVWQDIREGMSQRYSSRKGSGVLGRGTDNTTRPGELSRLGDSRTLHLLLQSEPVAPENRVVLWQQSLYE